MEIADMVRNIVILGATGSIGTSAINVIRRHRKYFNIIGIAANTSVERLAQIANEFQVENVGVGNALALEGRRQFFRPGTKFFFGETGLNEMAMLPEAESMLVATVGLTGLLPTLTAIEQRKTILLASKEILVVSGKFIIQRAQEKNVQLLPVDSEHNAIFQCLRAGGSDSVDRLILTASGGPFRNFSQKDLASVTAAQALQHPTWQMGKKISIDSATMVNKGFEIMEARWLFDIPADRIDVLIHPESIVHSMVQFCDGSVIAQMSLPNMEIPLANCLFYPERCHSSERTVNFAEQKILTFSAPDMKKFPALSIALQCLNAKNGNACAVFQAANEVAVGKFLAGKIGFSQITEIISATLNSYGGEPMVSIESCLNSAAMAREVAETIAK
ncbi:MAG: 1-deoxy-D-xylulose-5-phosphate reductoisomerase [Puniceicoccales bacterium]|jgi:1-deoxy-D-xylulose-5-phosphate reductoisomerase|nr:1-deoxy-D-xylulose-5-phosphate reductoisomerase [Puniceicoccales bacterium]